MALKITVMVTALAFGLVPVSEDFDSPESLAEQFGKALGLKLSELQTMPGPSREARGKVAKLTGTTARDLDGAEYWTSSIPHPRDANTPIKVFLTRIPLGMQDVGETLLICIDYTGVMVNGAVLDAKQKGNKKWSSLLSQRVGRPIPRLKDCRPVSHLDKYEQLRKTGTSDERLAGGLVSLRRLMLGHAAGVGWIIKGIEHGEKPKPKAVKKLAGTFKRLAELERPLKGLLGDAGKAFSARATKMSEHVADLAKVKLETDEGKEAAKALCEQVQKSCDACHKMTHDAFHGPLVRAAGHRRQELGLSEGFYLVGYDLYQEHEDKEQDQHVATMMRRAHLLLDRVVKR